MKALKTIFVSIAFFATINLNAQVAINDDGSLAGESAMLDVKSTSKGFLPPRMSEEQRNAITLPEAGLVVWCNNCGDNGELQVYNGTQWTNLIGETATHASYPCGVPLIDVRDNKSYPTVKIGTQCWMAQNLNVGTFINATTGGTNADGNQTDNGILEKYCYNNDQNNCNLYGGMYQWAELVQYLNGASNTASWNPVPIGNVRGLCPEGWHVPDTLEWNTLVGYVGNNGFSGTEGTALKSTSGWSEGGNGTDNFGFTALPGGLLAYGPTFYAATALGIFWHSTEHSTELARVSMMTNENTVATPSMVDKYYGLTVRCVAD